MEWVKSQISSPEGDEFKESSSYPVENDNSFTVFEPPRLELKSEAIIETTEQSEPEVFSLPGHFWGSLNSDRELKGEIQRIINEEVERKVSIYIAAEVDPLKKKVLESSKEVGHSEGYRLGLEKGYCEGRERGAALWREAQEALTQKSLDLKKEKEMLAESRIEEQTQFYERMNMLSSTFLKEKQNLLVEHEVIWVRALVQLLKKFLIKNSLEIGREVENWVHETVADFASTQKVQVFISKEDYARSQSILSSDLQRTFEVFCDPTLKNGDCRYECQGGGAIFSSQKELERLENMVESAIAGRGIKCN